MVFGGGLFQFVFFFFFFLSAINGPERQAEATAMADRRGS